MRSFFFCYRICMHSRTIKVLCRESIFIGVSCFFFVRKNYFQILKQKTKQIDKKIPNCIANGIHAFAQMTSYCTAGKLLVELP